MTNEDKINEIIRIACEKGGYRWKIDVTLESMLMDSTFWQALSKACGWGDEKVLRPIGTVYDWEWTAIWFMHTNLTEGWNAAVEYLESITNPQQ